MGRQTTLAQTTTELVFNASFDEGIDGFRFEKDVFRGTANPKYANGVFAATGNSMQATGSVLHVLLGGIDNASIRDMSGAFERNFGLPEPRRITIEFEYNLILSEATYESENGEVLVPPTSYESDEYSEVLVSVDRTMWNPIDTLTGGNDNRTSTG